jgi:thioredoxin-like negative regulator of GroEL
MKRHILPELRKRRCFGKIVFARVNADDEAGLAKRLTGGGPVPQLIMFRKTKNGWARRKLIGKQSAETVERFVEQGLALDAAGK